MVSTVGGVATNGRRSALEREQLFLPNEWLKLFSGMVLVGAGLMNRGLTGLLGVAGGAFLIYDTALKDRKLSHALLAPIRISGAQSTQTLTRTKTIYKPRPEVFGLLTEGNLQQFAGTDLVFETQDERNYKVRAVAGNIYGPWIDLRLTREVPDESLDWELQYDGETYAAGTLTLSDTKYGATKLLFTAHCSALFGKAGLSVIKAWPGSLIDAFFLRLKMYAETGEVARTE